MIQADLTTIAVAGALAITVLAVAMTATWRFTLRPWWQRFTWTPRLTPGIRAEVIMVMSQDGHVAIQFEKVAPEEDISAVFGLLTDQWFRVGGSLGAHLDWTSRFGTMRETPEGPEYTVALVRPEAPRITQADV